LYILYYYILYYYILFAISGRLLRANDIDFDWYRLSAWINVTEQWPYRTSWILLYYEEMDGRETGRKPISSLNISTVSVYNIYQL